MLRSTGQVAYGTNLLDDTHDLLLFQVMRMPSGGLIVYAYGGRGAGTAAAGWFLANVMIPSLSELNQAWYIYQWTDLGGELGPIVVVATVLEAVLSTITHTTLNRWTRGSMRPLCIST